MTSKKKKKKKGDPADGWTPPPGIDYNGGPGFNRPCKFLLVSPAVAEIFYSEMELTPEQLRLLFRKSK